MSAGARPSGQRARRRWREYVLALGSLLLALCLLELGARLWLPPTRYHTSPLEFDPVLGFRGIPHHHHQVTLHAESHEFALNADGLRGRTLPSAPAPAGVTRIALLGDSFLVGEVVAHEQLLASRLEALLRAEGQETEVYNLGVTDYGTAQEILLLDRVAERLQPDHVVLVLYTGNDIVNNWPGLAGRTIASPGDPIRPYLVADGDGLRTTWVDPWRARLRSGSRLFTFLERRAMGRSVEWRDLSIREPRRRRFAEGLAPREQLEVFRRHPPGSPWEDAWQNTFALVRALRDRCRALGAPLRVLVVPHAYQVERAARPLRHDLEARAFVGRPLDELLDWNLPERRLAAFLASADIPARLLLTGLREAGQARRVYAMDEHWNALGHQIAAESLAEWLGGEAEAEPSPAELSGGPIHMLKALGIGTRIDFREAPHDVALGNGWISWRPGAVGGWLTGPSALVALRAQPGDFVVRGYLPELAALPVEGRLVYVGGRSRRFELAQHGAFELRMSWGPGSGVVDAEGYTAILIAPGATMMRDGSPFGFLVQEVAFEPGA